jgi:putative hydrolase of the HAD superfamily
MSAPAPYAVLFDFGGVLTTSVMDAFAAFGESLGDRGLPLRLLSRDPEGAALLVDHEEGRITEAEFEQGFAARLAAHGVEVEADGLVRRMQSGLRPDHETIALVAELRAEGRPVGLLSNSFGDDCYAGHDLPAMFDAVTISAEIGVRKPSRRAFLLACERLGVAPEETVMVDDLTHNIDAAARVGMNGVVHTHARSTRAQLATLLGPATRHQPTPTRRATP